MPSSADVLSPPAALAFDANGDGRLTLGDVPSWLAHFFFLPGDWTLWALAKYAPPLASLLTDGAPAYGQLVSGFIAAVFWSIVLVAGTGYSYVVEMDRRATNAFGRLFAHVRRVVRVAARLLRTSLRRDPRDASSALDFTTQVELTALEVRVLRQLAELAPGYTAPPHEVAQALRLRVDEVRAPLDALVRQRLAIRTLGGAEGESGYALSSPGRAALLLKQLAPRSGTGDPLTIAPPVHRVEPPRD
jgi:hypothetical protein